ncbi:MAG TPA: protein-methionine-sulfoxide reductase catalytic subunit MsrP [Candidatus Limnocylindria bacterium]|nr:protein-methionine-sulfoxide reductase catalytic subunit MsrP [Candidatus Limnocylindria bacterium]
MHVIRRRGWEIPESQATPEHIFLNRRTLLAGAASAAATTLPGASFAQRLADVADPTADLYPVKRNEKFVLGRDMTPEKIASSYNNFYEFGFGKNIVRPAQALPIRPWTVKFDGMVEKEMTIGIDDIIRKMPLEERLYRMRCVEAWSMAVPWSGFAMAKLVELAKPLSSAKFIRMETFLNPSVAPYQKDFRYPWPYTEGCTIAEATNELAFMVTGIYGKALPKQHGAPIRLMLPWKYGFKSLKSIVRFTFTDQRPVGYWEKSQGSEYGFWANVNPKVSHPRWSQATEEDIGTGRRIPTELFNGYGEFVADLYKGMENEKLFM